MKTTVEGGPAFAHIHVDLEPGESIRAESDAMSSMAADLDMDAQFNGGFLSGLLKKFFGGESLFVNVFQNNTNASKRLTLVQGTPGDIHELDLAGGALCLQPGAYVASEESVQLGLKYAGIRSWIAREGLFKLVVSGHGRVWYGAFGGLLTHEVEGEFIVDTSHLVAYDPNITLKVQMAGGIFSSFFGGEGLVTRVVGKGKIVIQTRSLDGLRSWLNPKLW